MNASVKPGLNYTKPPIQEAVFDFQVRGGKSFAPNLFEAVAEEEGYIPHGFLQNVDIDTNTNTSKIKIIGCKYISQDQKKIAVFKKDGFSFSRLPIYDGWEKNCKTALELWKLYCNIIGPQIITRVATRFINKLRIPSVFTKPEEYFKTYIQYDKGLPAAWSQMSYNLLLPHNRGIKSNIRFDSRVSQNNQSVEVIFDTDVFYDNASLAPSDTSELDDIFNKVRTIKNSIFEHSITDKIRELIQ